VSRPYGAAALVATEPWAVQIVHVCECAQVELLHYPVHGGRRHRPVPQAVRRGDGDYSPPQTSNNQPGVLSARTIKALCGVLHEDHARRDSGLALLEAFDSIDLMAISDTSVLDAAVKKVGRVQAMAERIQADER
jgi:hypothetical protein